MKIIKFKSYDQTFGDYNEMFGKYC